MKSALLNSLEPGRICDVVDPGQEFDVSPAFRWVPCPDDITSLDKFDEESGEFVKFDMLAVPGFAEEGYKVARQIAYTSVGNQLDMLFKELQATGTISNTGPWSTHVADVKATIPKDDPAAVMAWNQWYVQQMQGNV